jgi:UDP-glucose 4-epimerase
VAASAKVQGELGWQPKFQNIDAIIESAWRWHQKFPNGYGD